MTDMLLQEDETLEELQPGGYLLLQKKNGFRFGMDSVLLAEFAGIRPHSSVADFGTGSCVLPLLLLSRNKGNQFRCIEIQQNIADMARRTVQINHLIMLMCFLLRTVIPQLLAHLKMIDFMEPIIMSTFLVTTEMTK